MSDETPQFFTDEFGNRYVLRHRTEVYSSYMVYPRKGASQVANAPRSDEERRELLRQMASVENWGVASVDIVDRLRDNNGIEETYEEAANEIEYLRQIVDFFLPHCRIVEGPAGLFVWIGDDECWPDPPDALVAEAHLRGQFQGREARHG